jgi:hypothetical protein
MTSCGYNAGGENNPGTGGPQATGTYEAHTVHSAGPGRFPRPNSILSIRDTNDVEIKQLTTDAAAVGAVTLPAGKYRVQPLPASNMLKEHTIEIPANTIVRDTIDYCPYCV